MLGKLIKHEFKATYRQLLSVLIVLLSTALISRFVVPAFEDNKSRIGEFIYSVDIMLFVISFIAVGIVALMLLINRYKKSILGDEGYLTMTLPVSFHEIIISKLITYFVWGLLISLAIFLALVIAIPMEMDAPVKFFFTDLKDMFPKIKAWKLFVLIVELLTFFFFMFSSFCLHFYSSMAVGNLCSKGRSFITALVFVGIMVGSFIYWGNSMGKLVDSWASNNNWILVGILFNLFALLQSCVLYCLTSLVMIKRFNID